MRFLLSFFLLHDTPNGSLGETSGHARSYLKKMGAYVALNLYITFSIAGALPDVQTASPRGTYPLTP